ncbi:MAG: hypothetical protein ACE5HE_09615 [Phycisphaerae bacterium]
MRKRGRPKKAGKERPSTASPAAVKQIDVKLPVGLYEQIPEMVKEGLFFSMSDFGRTAIHEKLAALGSIKRE